MRKLGLLRGDREYAFDVIIYYDSPPPCDVCDPRFSVAVGQRIGETLSSNMRPNEPVENVLKVGLAVGAVVGFSHVISKISTSQAIAASGAIGQRIRRRVNRP